MKLQIDPQTVSLIDSIQTLQSSIDQAIGRFTNKIQSHDPSKSDDKYWCNVAMNDSLAKLKLILNQNFFYIETMSLLAVTRYIHEMSIWLKLFDLDPRYGLV